MDRRKFLVGSGATIAAVAGLSRAEAALAAGNFNVPGYSIRGMDANPRPLQTQSNDLTPFSGTWTDRTLAHLLRRSMFGVPMSQFLAAKGIGGMNEVVEKLLADIPAPTKPGAWIDTILVPDASITDPTKKQIEFQNVQNHVRFQMASLQGWAMDNTLKEDLSIREKMTLLWSNHFVTGQDVVRYPTLMYSYDQMLRKNALGNLKDFVYSVSIEPAMLVYLNGNQNTYQIRNGKTINNINENYARELMELFTLGLTDPKTGAPNYSEADIQESAKALSGWLVNTTAPYASVFHQELHNNDTKSFLGQTGNFGLQEIIDIIFAKNGGYNVAYFVCSKIYAAFVYYVPDPQVVAAMAQLLIDSNWELKPVMRALLKSAHFFDANVIGAQLTSPLEYVGALIREFNLKIPAYDGSDPPANGTNQQNGYTIWKDLNATHTAMLTVEAILGQEILNPPNVKGWAGGH
ncbi:MAG: DUF1800 family protein, partial [Ignavibacteriota bacterium]